MVRTANYSLKRNLQVCVLNIKIKSRRDKLELRRRQKKQNRIEQNRIEQNRIGQDRIEQDRIGQNRIGQNRIRERGENIGKGTRRGEVRQKEQTDKNRRENTNSLSRDESRR